MLLYLLTTLLLLLNVFSQDTVLARECVDEAPKRACDTIERKYNCRGDWQYVAEIGCRRTCDLCGDQYDD
ncbi:hypothetical protein RB195_004239 [Necator americanus]|uniref:Uncharacterized protein n=2 Tax=Necator americanus TaxID=51031 RepID=A0ABR1BIS3_NECAM|nr:hypothetical protein NECAME_13825 [Necator americanus]ETN72537.1 hypothetical protein NECAME_13825 [Necator americanus]